MSREEEIRLIAYRIWEEEGCCHGHDIEHWLRAEVTWENGNKQQNVAVESLTKQQPVLKKEQRRKMSKSHKKD